MGNYCIWMTMSPSYRSFHLLGRGKDNWRITHWLFRICPRKSLHHFCSQLTAQSDSRDSQPQAVCVVNTRELMESLVSTTLSSLSVFVIIVIATKNSRQLCMIYNGILTKTLNRGYDHLWTKEETQRQRSLLSDFFKMPPHFTIPFSSWFTKEEELCYSLQS